MNPEVFPKPVEKEEAPFDPKIELRGVLKLPRDKRRQALESWKEKYAGQKEGLAFLQAEIIKRINGNPNLSKEELMKVVDVAGSTGHFTDKQKKIAESAIDIYIAQHQVVRGIRQEYADDAKLFEIVFRSRPLGKIIVEEGPNTLYFKCSDSRDFATLYTRNRGKFSYLTHLALRFLKIYMIRGVFYPHSVIPELDGTIMAEDTGIKPKEFSDTKSHEGQHALYNLFVMAKQRMAIEDKPADEIETERKFKDILEASKEIIEDNLADELLTQLKGGLHWRTALRHVAENYLNMHVSWEIYRLQEELKKIKESANGKTEAHGNEEVITHVIKTLKSFSSFKDKLYFEIVGAGRAFDKLRSYFTLEQTTALLMNENLPQWRKVADRLIDQKRKKDQGK